MTRLFDEFISLTLSFFILAPQFLPTAMAAPPVKAITVQARSAWAEQLEAARRFQTIGEYEKAARGYQAVLATAPTDAAERAEASYLLGETYLQAELYKDSIKALTAFAEGYPQNERYGQAIFLCGRAYQALGSWSEAIARYQKYLSIDRTVDSFVYELMGDCYLAAGDYGATEEAYRRGLAGPIDQPMKLHLLEGIADAQTKSAKYEAAVVTYDAILEEAKGDNYRARIEYQAGQALAAAGKMEASYVRYRRAVDNYPTAYHAYLSLIEVVNAGKAVDEFKRGLIDYYSEAYVPAIQAFDRYIKSAPAGYAGEAHYYAGLAYQEAGNYAQAIDKFDYVINHYPDSAHLGEAWIAKGKTLSEQGKAQDAAELWTLFAKQRSTDPLAPEALWLTGTLWEQEGRFAEAATSYADVQARYPGFTRSPAALYQAGLCAFRASQYGEAVEYWQKLVDSYKDSPTRPAALYWLGRAFHAQGRNEQALTTLSKLQGAYPGNYYAIRAEEFQQTWSAKLFQKPAQKNVLFNEPTSAEQVEAEAWLVGWLAAKPAAGESLSQLPANVANDGRLRRGLLLWQLGLTSDASSQVRGLITDFNDSPLDLYRLGVFLQQEGLYRLSVSCIERLVALAPGEKKASLPTFLLKLTHPFHFSDLIVTEALRLDLDPLLLLALVRQESSFEWQVASWAGARGLMQIMPTTGDWIALQLAWKGYTGSGLYRPYLNVRFGTWYLARQLASFQGDMVASLTAYNAGPKRAADWQTPDMEKDDDLFLEYMPLTEPRTYVEKVYSHYRVYCKLYAGQ